MARHPQLVRTGPGTVEGGVLINAEYEGEIINERFDVRITKANPASDRVPALYETGGRTNAIAAKRGLADTRDLHRNPDNGSACVCVKQEEATRFPPSSDLSFFIDGLARDYLYGLAFYDRHGRWPWGERAHGSVGLLEFYADNDEPLTNTDIETIVPYFVREKNWLEFDKQLRRPKEHRACICGSGEPFGKCHPKALQGLLALTAEIDRLGMKRRSLFDRARTQLAKGI
ncbi:hypothetical protein SAMN02745126_04837 [Enhydrobacter aerosaccus]|uniref:SEC-C motif-containing protein n=1 Tax=Enhydrobacter aerosaccus TaxID=225324 RepID=A0A1T4SKZ2_9HYPH|nr:hypothetical protein SAMN02745126_04837 [Enhydrobacter aerosaccus]